ncbi:MAG: hypothetical protein IKD85_03395 [Firmicutes bacterium]|nr:hypothetical protein [Bacillota bacterium]
MKIMSFDDFSDRAGKEIRDWLPDLYKDAEVEMQTVERLRGAYTGMTVVPGEQMIAPIINLQEFYDLYLKDPDWEKVIRSMADMVTRFSRLPDMGWLSHYEQVKGSLFLKLCSIEGNEQLLEDMPHWRYADLALTMHIRTKYFDNELYSVAVTRDMAEEFGVTEEDMLKDAFDSAQEMFPVHFEAMEHVLKGGYVYNPGSQEPCVSPAGSGMLLLTNQYMLNGASALFYPGVLKEAAVLLDGSYYILPSSIHELILLPEEFVEDYRDVERTVRRINRMQVAPEDWLSDHVYHYDNASALFERADVYEQRKALRNR